jgi:hypothetical protein
VTEVVYAMGRDSGGGTGCRRPVDGSWFFVKGSYEIQMGRSIADRRVTATINV